MVELPLFYAVKFNSKGHLRKNPQVALVEAAGIEPASRDISKQASTCVADRLGFARRSPDRQGLR